MPSDSVYVPAAHIMHPLLYIPVEYIGVPLYPAAHSTPVLSDRATVPDVMSVHEVAESVFILYVPVPHDVQ